MNFNQKIAIQTPKVSKKSDSDSGSISDPIQPEFSEMLRTQANITSNEMNTTQNDPDIYSFTPSYRRVGGLVPSRSQKGSYCPPQYRNDGSPISHGSQERNWRTSALAKPLKGEPDDVILSAGKCGTGFASAVKGKTQLWDPRCEPLSSGTIYRESYRERPGMS
jgi:hypothetical protein